MPLPFLTPLTTAAFLALITIPQPAPSHTHPALSPAHPMQPNANQTQRALPALSQARRPQPALSHVQPAPDHTQPDIDQVPTPGHARPAQPGGSVAVWPLSPRPEVVRGFEPPPKPWLPGHRGLDLRGSPGQQVRSATPGKVTYAGPLAGRGVIVITNGPLRTTYEPVIPTVRPGATVTPGTPLGNLSSAASHCAPATCLHWGLLKSTTYLNPLTLLPHRPIRLLPLTPPATSAVPASYPGLSHQTASAPHPAPPAAAQPSPRGGLTSGVIVGLAAAATLIGSLMIRRH